MVHKHWSLCRYARGAVYISSYALYLVSLLTLTAINPDRLLSLLLGMRYRQIETLKRTCIILDFFRRRCIIFCFAFSNKHLVWYRSYTFTLNDLNRLVHKDISHSQTSSGSSTRSCSTTAEPTKCAKHGNIQEGSKQCTLGAVSISCLLCTKIYTVACDHL